MAYLVTVLGYSPEGMAGGEEPEEVWHDRIDKALRLAERLSADLAISGGVQHSGKSEAELMADYAEKEFERFERETVILEENSLNTIDNINQMDKLAEDYECVFFVSSRDHVPYIQRIAEENFSREFYTVASSENTLKNKFWHVYKLLRKGRI